VSQADDDRRLLTERPSFGLEGRVVWLTGASRGLGRTLAYAFAGAGAQLLLCARSAEALDEVAGEIRAQGATAEVLAGSIADPDVVAQAARLIEERWGRLDALVNNAGISPAFTRAERLDLADWHSVLDTNLTAPLLTSRAALPWFEAAGGGSIVNVSSIHGSRAHERLLAYAASKGGMEMVTRTLAVEWADRNVRVNSVAPGYLQTDMTAGLLEHERWGASLRARIPMGRVGATGEIAPAILFLAGAASSYITGTTLFIDGGWTAG
jgi:NAD(P)-dependent dehydrogenase (short-subunit alcohol dehydrogenase family)